LAFQAVPDTIEVVFDFLLAGTPAANVIHVKVPGGYVQADLDALTANMDAEVSTNIIPLLATNSSYVGVRARGLNTSSDLSSSNSDNAGVGTATGDPLPNNVSLCLTVRTAFTGRSARGRIYTMPPTLEEMAAPNFVTSAFRDALIAAYEACRTRITSLGYTMVVVSRFTGGVKRSVGVTFNVTAIVARNTRTDSQRGRMPLPS